MNKIKFLFVPIALLFLAVPLVRAAEFIAPDSSDGNITLASAEKHHNLYLSGQNVTVENPTTGDLYAAGGTISVEGDVEQDLVLAGGTLYLNGKVGGDVRAGGGNLNIKSAVLGDVIIAGGNVVISDKASVAGDLVVAGGTVVLNAPVTGNVIIAGGSVNIDSKLSGSVKIYSNKQVVFGSHAVVEGKVIYRGQEAAVIKDGAHVPNLEFIKQKAPTGSLKAFVTGALIIKLLAMVLAGLLLLYVLRRRVGTVVQSVYDHPWSNLGIGLIGFIVIPIACLLLLVAVVGYYVSFMVFLWFIFACLLTSLVAGIFLGTWIIKILTKKPDMTADWQAVVIGTVVFYVLWFIPVLGALLIAALFLATFGGVLRMVKNEILANK